MDLLINLSLVLGGLFFLVFGANLLVKGAASLALRFGVPSLVVGLTIVAFGTSAPELVIALNAAVQGKGDIALGNVIGSNIANVGLILAITALVMPLAVQSRVIKFDTPFMLLVSGALVLMLWDNLISRYEALGLFITLIIFTYFLFRLAKKTGEEDLFEAEEEPLKTIWHDLAFILLGGICLAGGGELLIRGAVAVAEAANMSEAAIGLTIIAVGTSAPELATCLVAAREKKADIAVGNIIGSNIQNILLILGVSGTIIPLQAVDIQWIDLITMLGLSIVLLPLMSTGFKLTRLEGFALLVIYVTYIVVLLINEGVIPVGALFGA